MALLQSRASTTSPETSSGSGGDENTTQYASSGGHPGAAQHRLDRPAVGRQRDTRRTRIEAEREPRSAGPRGGDDLKSLVACELDRMPRVLVLPAGQAGRVQALEQIVDGVHGVSWLVVHPVGRRQGADADRGQAIIFLVIDPSAFRQGRRRDPHTRLRSPMTRRLMVLLRWLPGRGDDADMQLKGFRFPKEIVLLAVRWYLRHGLSYRDLEEMLEERGVCLDQHDDLSLGATLHAAAHRRRDDQEEGGGRRVADG